MRCIVHIGLQKCGSTSLQAWLTANRDALKEAGVMYPRSLGQHEHVFLTAIGMGFSPSHWVIEDTGAKTREAYDAWRAKTSKEFAAELRHLPGDTKAVVFSHEDLSALAPDAAARCVDWLRGHFDAVEIIGYVRPPAELASAWLSQEAKNGLLDDPVAILKTFHAPLGRIAQTWHRAADACRWRAVSQVGDIVQDFCAILGVEAEDFQEVTRKNLSISKPGFDLLQVVKPPFRVDGQQNFNAQMFLDELPNQQSFKISKADAEVIQARHSQEIDAFLAIAPDVEREHLGVDLSDYPEHVVFDREPPSYETELQFIIRRLNAQIWLERCAAQLNRAEVQLARKKPMVALQVLSVASEHLRRARQVDAERVKMQSARLQTRLANMTARAEKMARNVTRH